MKPKSYSREFFVESGRVGGKAKTPKKSSASRVNGMLGGAKIKSKKSLDNPTPLGYT